MPNHRTPHHTDGKGIGKKLRGLDLNDRLVKLRKKIIWHHDHAKESWEIALAHARNAGEALIEVKRRLGHRLKWSRWRYAHLIKECIMSKQTCLDYMRIAREWEHPRLADARANGIQLDSIKKCLGLLRGEPAGPRPKVPDKPEPIDKTIARLEKLVGRELRKLSEIELREYDACWPLFWDNGIRELKDRLEYPERYARELRKEEKRRREYEQKIREQRRRRRRNSYAA